MIRSLLLILIMFTLSACSWHKKKYMTDLNFIYNSIIDNHPGIYNEHDPNFSKKLDQFYNEARIKITQSQKDLDLQKAIIGFTKSFNDTHLGVNWINNISEKPRKEIFREFSISRLGKSAIWVNLPTFDLNIQQEKDFDQLVKNILKFQKEKYIIFDLRGNQGGNSEYGSKILSTLFGKEYAQKKKCSYNKNIYIDWRVSKGNLNHISSLLNKYPNSTWLQNIEHGLKESLKRGNNFYREYGSDFCKANNNQIFLPETKSTMIVVIDSANVSAALDFIDELKMMTPNLILIGQKTNSDRLYMEVRSVLLPSGAGNLFFPIKVYRNRFRLDNEPYRPNIEFPNIHNMFSLQSFILEQIENKKL